MEKEARFPEWARLLEVEREERDRYNLWKKEQILKCTQSIHIRTIIRQMRNLVHQPNFPEWVWVFEDAERNSASHMFTTFTLDLQAATAADGYQVEFIYLYRSHRMTPKSGWEE